MYVLGLFYRLVIKFLDASPEEAQFIKMPDIGVKRPELPSWLIL